MELVKKYDSETDIVTIFEVLENAGEVPNFEAINNALSTLAK